MKLGKRKLPNGTLSYFLDDYHEGKRIRESLDVLVPPGVDPSFSKNQKRLAEKLFQARQAEILLARKGLVRDESVSIVTYAGRLAVNRDRQDHVVRLLPYLREHFGDRELRTLDYRACDSFQAFLSTSATSEKTKRGLSAKTVRHYFNAFAFVLNEAVRDRYLETSPASAVRRVRVPEKVVIALNAEELKRLWECPMVYSGGEPVKVAFFVSVNTGLRVGDLRSLRWGDIQTDSSEGWRLVKAQDKTGNLVTVPLNSTVRELLTPRFSLNPRAPVFPEFQTVANVVRYVSKWARDAGISKPVSFHTARHSYGTLLGGTGANAILIQKLMGHTTRAMTEHYSQAAGEEARALVEALPKFATGRN